MKTFTIENENDLQLFANQFAASLRPGAIIFLHGPLGAGKTTFVRCCLRALHYDAKVKSPTYTIVEQYELNNHIIYHFDLYRLQDPSELQQIGINEYFTEQAICFIEWAEKGLPLLPRPDLDCYIEFNDKTRQIKIKAMTQKGETIIEQL